MDTESEHQEKLIKDLVNKFENEIRTSLKPYIVEKPKEEPPLKKHWLKRLFCCI